MATNPDIPSRFQVKAGKTTIVGPQRQLFQTRPAGTSAATAWTAPYFGQYKFTTIRATNVTASPVVVSIYHDDDGSTYDQTSALEYQVTLPANGSMTISNEVAGYSSGGTVGVQTATGSAVNFTGYGSIANEEVAP